MNSYGPVAGSETYTGAGEELSLLRVIGLIGLPTTLLTATYIIVGLIQDRIPSLLLFFLLAMVILFPFELSVVLRAGRRQYGRFSLRSACTDHSRMSWWKILVYASVLFGFAGLMTAVIVPFELRVTAPLARQLHTHLPAYFDWTDIEQLRSYSKGIVVMTCIAYVLLNGFVGPIIEELFFRGYLTSGIRRYGRWAPLIITVLFSLYHLWLPFNNLFRIAIFLPAAYAAWKKKNLYLSIWFHCLCNLFSSASFIIAVYGT
ncbi:MAG: CPBP family intramembrane metalloprotease [Spirochaetia bacterium]|nr:CPBP family intramembrane metalloprotease [Spirochaetia bacterium]MCF7940403.1 CPBP family intramembrane metalloprotease [Spirochaetia bacterium]